MNYKTSKADREFSLRIENTNIELLSVLRTLKGEPVHVHHVKDCHLMTESSIKYPDTAITGQWENVLLIRSTDAATSQKTSHTYSLGTVNPYTAETALFLGMHPAKLALKPELANDHLAGFGAGQKEMDLYRDLGMSTQDAAHSIRMRNETAQTDQGDAQAASNFLAGLDSNDLMADDRGMSHGF